jgi:hypothetical protein
LGAKQAKQAETQPDSIKDDESEHPAKTNTYDVTQPQRTSPEWTENQGVGSSILPWATIFSAS